MVMNPDLYVPWGYGTRRKSLASVKMILEPHYHPEYLRRLLHWLEYKNGKIGIGGHFRPDGTQPDKAGFAPEGRSFHQNQLYSDGFIGACAVDVVRYNPGGSHVTVRDSDVPVQGSDEAKKWGLHANVSKPGQSGWEPWHIQPIEIDGWKSWDNAGNPAPEANYPLPDWPKQTPPPLKDADMKRFLWRPHGYANVFLIDGAEALHLSSTTFRAVKPENLPFISGDKHPSMLISVVHKAGMQISDLEKINED